MTADLIARVRAHLDEDERIAQLAVGYIWTFVENGNGSPSVAVKAGVATTIAFMPDRWSRGSAKSFPHIARQDPPRVLRGVAAKRRIVDAYELALTAAAAEPLATYYDRDGTERHIGCNGEVWGWKEGYTCTACSAAAPSGYDIAAAGGAADALGAAVEAILTEYEGDQP